MCWLITLVNCMNGIFDITLDYIFIPCTFVRTWQSPKTIDDLLPPLLQREPVLTHHQPEHDQRHKLTSVGLHRCTKQTLHLFTETERHQVGGGSEDVCSSRVIPWCWLRRSQGRRWCELRSRSLWKWSCLLCWWRLQWERRFAYSSAEPSECQLSHLHTNTHTNTSLFHYTTYLPHYLPWLYMATKPNTKYTDQA